MKEKESDSPLSNFVFLVGSTYVRPSEKSKSSLTSRPPSLFCPVLRFWFPRFSQLPAFLPWKLIWEFNGSGPLGTPSYPVPETRSRSKNAPLTALYVTTPPTPPPPANLPSSGHHPVAHTFPGEPAQGLSYPRQKGAGAGLAWGNRPTSPLRVFRLS